jgi:hypothetical protein
MDIPAAILFLLLAAYIFMTADTFPVIGWKMGGSPAFYPRILAVLMVVLAVAMFWKSRSNPTVAVFPMRRKVVYMLSCLAACLLMPLVLLPLLGFRISAFIFMFLVMIGSRKRVSGASEVLRLAGASILVSGIIYGAFTYLARVRLPLGSITGW